MRYLTDWRMTLARDHLRMDELSISPDAQRVGYGSPNAFASTFQRHHGHPPGRWRDDQRDKAPSSSARRNGHGAGHSATRAARQRS